MGKRIFGIKLTEIGALLGTYFILSIIYHITLYINRLGFTNEKDVLFSPVNWFDDAGLQYGIMCLSTFCIWFFIFKIFKHTPLSKRLALHILGLPLFVLASWQLYYLVSDLFGMGHLSGAFQVWDVYIPTLIYLIQFALIHAYEYYVINQRKLQYEIELKNTALKSELSAIKAQLNPHFLYNVFNTINASVPKEMEETREMIAELSDLFRYQLKASREDFVTLDEELDFVKKYLALEQKRFEERLQITIKVPDALRSRKVPPMILQPIVENSVKHGISPLVDGGSIRIAVCERNGKLIFEISDTGVGVADTNAILNLGVGLSNTQKRLQKMYQSSLQISNNIPSGLKIQFEL